MNTEKPEIELWNVVQTLLSEKKKSKGLLVLFSELGELCQLHKDFYTCNEFIKYAYDKIDDSDIIVHILNVLSPYRNHLSFWNEFASKSREVLIELRGEEAAKSLMQVIVDKVYINFYSKKLKLENYER